MGPIWGRQDPGGPHVGPMNLALWEAMDRFLLSHNRALQWCHNGHDSVSNHQPHDCLLNRLFRRRLKKTSKLRVTGLCAGNSPGTGEFPAQMASYAENVSIWWRHHGLADIRALLPLKMSTGAIIIQLAMRNTFFYPAHHIPVRAIISSRNLQSAQTLWIWKISAHSLKSWTTIRVM